MYKCKPKNFIKSKKKKTTKNKKLDDPLIKAFSENIYRNKNKMGKAYTQTERHMRKIEEKINMSVI